MSIVGASHNDWHNVVLQRFHKFFSHIMITETIFKRQVKLEAFSQLREAFAFFFNFFTEKINIMGCTIFILQSLFYSEKALPFSNDLLVGGQAVLFPHKPKIFTGKNLFNFST